MGNGNCCEAGEMSLDALGNCCPVGSEALDFYGNCTTFEELDMCGVTGGDNQVDSATGSFSGVQLMDKLNWGDNTLVVTF